MEDYYQDENVTKVQEHLSPHGGYKLVVKTYDTGKVSGRSTWEYTQGFVYDMENNLIGTIKRNYSSFPFVFFKQGTKQYLVSGRSYMKQTILDLDNGMIYDNTDEPDSDDFCWADIAQLDENTVVVSGCYWGGGYEYKFFDFINLSGGWPELKVEESVVKKRYIECYAISKHNIENNIITIGHMVDYNFEDENSDENSDDYDDYDDTKISPNSDIIIRLCRDADIIKMVDLKLSEVQVKREVENEIKQIEEDKNIAKFRSGNMFYQQLIGKINEFDLEVLNLRIRDSVSFFSNTFNINIYYKKTKCVAITFDNNNSIVKFIFYDWRNKDNNLNMEFKQNLDIIGEIIEKIKELLVV